MHRLLLVMSVHRNECIWKLKSLPPSLFVKMLALHMFIVCMQVCNLVWSKNVNELVSTHGYSQNQIIVWRYPTMSKVQMSHPFVICVTKKSLYYHFQYLIFNFHLLSSWLLSRAIHIEFFILPSHLTDRFCTHNSFELYHPHPFLS